MHEPSAQKIKAVCSGCGATYLVEASRLGRQARCLKCQVIFTVTQAQTAPPAGSAGSRPKETAAGQQNWNFKGLFKTSCPRCGVSFNLARSFLGSYIACPQCKERFVVGEEGQPRPQPEPSFIRKILGRRNVRYALISLGAFFLILLAGSLLADYQRNVRLMSGLSATYPPPNYEISRLKTPAKDYVKHKVGDGSRECQAVAFVRISHKPSAMAFDRVLCEAGGKWAPTFRQRIADEVATEFISELEGSGPDFNPGDMVWQIFDQKSPTFGQLYATALPEEVEVRMQCGPALAAMSSIGETDEPSQTEDDDEFVWDFDSSAYYEKYYQAQAVMYPDQAQALYDEGLIREIP